MCVAFGETRQEQREEDIKLRYGPLFMRNMVLVVEALKGSRGDHISPACGMFEVVILDEFRDEMEINKNMHT